MKKLVLAAALMLAAALPAYAQIVCGPVGPSYRSANPDGTFTIMMNASCEQPDPANWNHTYTIKFPSVVTYYNVTGTFQFVGNASAEVTGEDACAARYTCGLRLVTVDSASLTDPSGASVPVQKVEVGTAQKPIDQWRTTAPLQADTLYSFTASGTDKGVNPGTDSLHIQATYMYVPPPPPPPCTSECGDGVIISE